MAHTLLRSNEQLNFASNINLDESISSSDAGDVLIRSTRIHFPEWSNDKQGDSRSVATTSNKPDTVQITVKKLRDAPEPSVADEQQKVEKPRRSKKQDHVPVPPVLRANLAASASAPLSGHISERPKMHRGHSASNTAPGIRRGSKEAGGDEKPQPQSSGDTGHDLLVSRYSAGAKGVVLAALKQRSQNAPLRREVKVQLLDQRSSTQSAEPLPGTLPSGYGGAGQASEPLPHVPLPSGDQGVCAASTAAVLTAATIAATAPLFKAQSDMEARVSHVSESLRRLLEADGRPCWTREGREEREGGRTSERVAQLEQQFSSLTQQRLQHLEMIQNQQMELQSRLLVSALSVVTGHASVTPAPPLLTPDPSPVPGAVPVPGLPGTRPGPQPAAAGRSQTHLPVVELCADTAPPDPASQRRGGGGGQSPPETPAPRRVVPKPTHWNSSDSSSNCPQKAQTTSSQDGQISTQRSAQPGSRTAHSQAGSRAAAQSSTRPHSAREARPGTKPQRTPPRTPQGSDRLLEALLDNRRRGTPAAAGAGTRPAGVAVATRRVCDGDKPPEQPREDQQQPEASRVPTATPDRPPNSASTNHSDSSAVHKANQMLRDLGRLKAEMHTLLTVPDVLPGQSGRATPQPGSSSTARPPAPPTTATAPPPLPASSTDAAGEVQVPATAPLTLAGPPLLQRTPPAPSMFEDAEKVLRQVQRNRKVLDENLQAMLRAKDGEVLHCQLEALANNRDTIEEVRIKKTVDAWITALSKDIQTEIAGEEQAAQRRARETARDVAAPTMAQQKTHGTRDSARGAGAGRGKTPGVPRAAGNKAPSRESRGQAGGPQGQTKHTRPGAKLGTAQRTPRHSKGEEEEEEEEERRPGTEDGAGEDYLVKLYGKALYEGHRRTLKKGPYLRFSSPSPRSKAPRPRVVESVRGVKMKSSKTQTSPGQAWPASSSLHPSTNQAQYIFSPTRAGLDDPCVTPMEGFLIPMAVPLGKPRVDGVPPQPSRVIISSRPIVVTTSLPPSPPRPPRAPRKPTVTLLEVRSEQGRRPPQLTVQVQPSVNIEPPAPEPSASPAGPLPDIQAGEEPGERRSGAEEEEKEEEENVFPGTEFLAVGDISRDSSQEPEQSEVSEGVVELEGQASPPAALYHGPVFPPQPGGALPAPAPTDPVLSTILHRETLENRLVDWVEQQLMARVISQMYRPPPSDPAQDQSVQSEPEEKSETSDIVEAAGGGGLQLFVDANIPVDSALIRQYVNEALAETIAQMLGQRDGQTQGQERPAATVQTQRPSALEDRLVPTPLPTPEPSASPAVPSREPSPLGTPELSEGGSPEQTPRDSPAARPQTSTPAEPVVTPASTPAPSPPTPSPLERNHPWGDAELPLAEEQPHSHSMEVPTQPSKPLVMSVAVEEPLPISPPPSIPPPQATRSPTPPAAPLPGPETPSLALSSSAEDSSSSSSSSTVTGTDSAVKHISEGELLISYNQLAAAQGYEEGFCLPGDIPSFSSSLHEVQDMDYDPPSEGQVRRPQVPPHHDPLLSLLAKMDQGVFSTQTDPRPPPGGTWELEEEGSVGEVSEGQRPRLTLAGERIMTGQSLLAPRTGTAGSRPHRRPPGTTDPRSRVEAGTTGAQRGQASSPGQLSQSADLTQLTLGDTCQGPVTIGDLGVDPGMSAMTPPLQMDSSQSPPPPLENSLPREAQVTEWSSGPAPARPAPLLVRQYQGRPEEQPPSETQGGPRMMSVRLPSASLEQEEVLEEEEASVSLGALGGGDTDSSGNNVF